MSGTSRGTGSSSNNTTSNSGIPLQPSAPVYTDLNLGAAYPSALQMPQSQLVVALPPENHHSYSMPDPPPPYPGVHNPSQATSMLSNPTASMGLSGVGGGGGVNIGGSSRSMSSAVPQIPGPSHGYGEGRGHYNRKGITTTANMPNTGNNSGKLPGVPGVSKGHLPPQSRHRSHR